MVECIILVVPVCLCVCPFFTWTYILFGFLGNKTWDLGSYYLPCQSTRTTPIILVSMSKIQRISAYMLIHPEVWPMLDERSGGYNKAGLFLAVLSICELASRVENKEELGRNDPNQMTKPAVNSFTEARVSNWLPPSLALGSLIFSLHCFLTDSSTLIAWTWTGYPIRGPVPHLHGSLTLLAQSVGMMIPMFGSSAIGFLRSPWWFVFGLLSSYTLHSYNDWLGYIGGSGFAIFLMSIIPQTLQKAAASPFIGRTYFMSFFIAIILYLANVWTVAYAFVPGGNLLRERSDLYVLSFCIYLLPLTNIVYTVFSYFNSHF